MQKCWSVFCSADTRKYAMANYDEAMLRSGRVRPDARFPVLHQALRLALYDRYAARAFDAAVIEAFGSQAPFASLLQSADRHIDALSRLCRRYGVPRPGDPFPAKTVVSPAWRANLERAAMGAAATVRLCQHLLPYAVAP
jgi:2-hydroxychromene-2-carboxylate isomerase